MTIDELIPRQVSKIEFGLLLTVMEGVGYPQWLSGTVLVNLKLGRSIS